MGRSRPLYDNGWTRRPGFSVRSDGDWAASRPGRGSWARCCRVVPRSVQTAPRTLEPAPSRNDGPAGRAPRWAESDAHEPLEGCGAKRPPCADGVSPDVCDLTCAGAGSGAEVRLSLAELMELEVPPWEWTERILGPVRDRAAAGSPAELDDLDRQFWYACVGAVCDRLGNHTPAMQVYVLGFGREPGPVPRLPATRGLARCGFSVEIVFRVIVGRFRAVSGVSSGDQGREGCPCCG
jgi:hypothetical protein